MELGIYFPYYCFLFIPVFNYRKSFYLTTESKVLAFGGIGAVILLMAAKARTVGNLIFMPGNVLGMSYSNLSPVLSLSMWVQNTSAFSVSVDSFAGQVLSNGSYVGNVYNFSPVLLPANSQTLIPLDIRLQPLGIVNEIMAAFQTKNFTQRVQIKGFINSGVLQIPIDLNFSIGQ